MSLRRTMAEITLMQKLFYNVCAGRRLFSIAGSHYSPLILSSHFAKIFSRLVRSDSTTDINDHFAHFAATKFNLSAADIERIFRFVPRLRRLQTLDNVEEFVDLLEKNGFKQDQISLIMRRQPSLLITSVDRILEPKLRLLKESVIDGEKVAIILTRCPMILGASLQRELLPKLTLLKNVFQSQDLFIKAILFDPSILTYNLEKTLKPSLYFWEQFGFRGTELAKFSCTRRSILRCSSLTPAQVDLIHKIGIERGSKVYKLALSLVACSRSDTLEAKIHNFQMCGLTADETMEVIRARPFVFGYSTERVRQNMEFLVNHMELTANSVVKHPHFLEINLEKVKPRVLVLQEMKSMNRLRHLEVNQVSTILKMPEAKFLSKIVGGHPESSTLYGIYERASADASNSRKIPRKVFCF